MGSQDWIIWLLLYLVIAWLVIYTAVRAAVGHASDRRRPLLIARTSDTPDGLRATIQNRGTASALDLKVTWAEAGTDGVLASALLLAVDDRLDFIADPSTGLPLVVRKLAVQWTDAAANQHVDHLSVLAPHGASAPVE
jgi:hypothetical protein